MMGEVTDQAATGDVIVHVTSREAWEASRGLGFYEPDGLETERFIHCCTPEQLEGVLERWFQGDRAGLVVLMIDPRRLTSELRWEDGLPHVYGPLDVDAVTSVRSLPGSP